MSYQTIVLVGNVGRDAELRYTQGGIAVCDFSLAVNKKWKDANGTEHKQTTWYRVACWRRTAEVVAQYVKKGDMVLVESDTLKASAYTAQDGTLRASLDVTANTVRFLSGKSDGNGGDNRQPDNVTNFPNENDIPF